MDRKISFTNEMGEFLAPHLTLIRSTGFFEAYVFIPLMTLLAIGLFLLLLRALRGNQTFETGLAGAVPRLYLASCFFACFLVTNATAVAFKTLIHEELDYDKLYWYTWLVSPLHFYIVSVTGAYLWLILRNKTAVLDRELYVYVQIGLIGGYAIAVDRLLNEPFELLDITTGVSGIFQALWFAFLNLDILMRLFRRPQTVKRQGGITREPKAPPHPAMSLRGASSSHQGESTQSRASEYVR